MNEDDLPHVRVNQKPLVDRTDLAAFVIAVVDAHLDARQPPAGGDEREIPDVDVAGHAATLRAMAINLRNGQPGDAASWAHLFDRYADAMDRIRTALAAERAEVGRLREELHDMTRLARSADQDCTALRQALDEARAESARLREEPAEQRAAAKR